MLNPARADPMDGGGGVGLLLAPLEKLLERLYGDAYRSHRSRVHRYFGPPRNEW
jgi:hypothetical protein